VISAFNCPPFSAGDASATEDDPRRWPSKSTPLARRRASVDFHKHTRPKFFLEICGNFLVLQSADAMILAQQVYGFDPRLMPDAGSGDIVSFIARRLAQRRVEHPSPERRPAERESLPAGGDQLRADLS
jgi:hypothetical protein